MPVNTSNQLFKFRMKNWVEINEDARVTYNINSQINFFKKEMIKSSLHNYSDAHKLVKGTITVK